MIRLFWLALLLSTQTLAAQIVSVRSGEHPGFTRLVLTQPSPSAWEFGRSETGYVIKMRGNIKGFDLSTAFDRIGRTRVNGLAELPTLGLLALDLGCDCHAIATPFRPGVIVIDISDGPAPEASPYEDILALPGAPESWIRPTDLLRPPRRPDAPSEASAATLPRFPPLGPRRLMDRRELSPSAQHLRLPDARAELLAERLSLEMARGIAAGAISAARPPSATPSRPQVLPTPGPITINDVDAGPQINMRPPGGAPSREPPASGVACIPPEALNLAGWGDSRPAWLQIAELRLPILSEFDRPDPSAILKLARLFLHLGFGAEARDLLKSWPLDRADLELLSALGGLLDGTTIPPTFVGMQACDGPAALWAVLEQNLLPKATDSAPVLRSFSDLPPWLRRDLGPRLAQRFLAAGDLVTAQSLEQILTRKLPPQSPEAALISGQLDLAQGRADTAASRLDIAARSNTPLAPAAMAILLEQKLTRGEPISETEITELEALAHSERGGAEARALRRTLARGLIATGAVARSFETIAPQSPELYPELWELLTQRGSDADLSSLALSPPPSSLRDLPASTRHKLAKRLIAAGFPSNALRMMETLTGPEADLSRARAHLALRDGRSVLRSLAGAGGTEAATLRAEALELMADFSAAEQAWNDAGNEPRAARLRLLRQDWAALPASTSEPLRALAESLTQDPELPPEPLARARAQLAAASGLRDAALNLVQTGLER